MITIRVVSRAGVAPAAPLAATFDGEGGDIGRSVECTLVLPDPDRRISRRQVRIHLRDGAAHIRRLSPHLPVELDGQPLALEEDRPLPVGAELRIGAYLMRVEAAAAPDAGHALSTAGDGAFPPLAAGEPRQSVFSDLLAEPAVPASPPIDLEVGEADAADGAALCAALYEGLGLRPPAAGACTAQQMKLVGSMLRATLQGTLDLLATRTIAKRELGADATLLQARENNPLKFSPDADAALSLLLGPAQRGFLAPQKAVRDAFDDLRAHELAVLTGMRAALDAVLARFDPQALETRLAASGSLAALLPARRKAQVWDRYRQEYGQILREIESEVDSLFGRAFLGAYQAQLARLRDAPGEAPGA